VLAATSVVLIRLTTLYRDLWHTNNINILLLFVHHKSRYSVVSLGRCTLFPYRVGLRNYQHPCSTNIPSHNLRTTVLSTDRPKH